MSTTKFVRRSNSLFIAISLLALTSVSLLSLYDPQSTMDLVKVHLGNTDALSSIRGVYGGVGITIIVSILYLAFTQKKLAVNFLTLFWGSYAVSRLITMMADGPLGTFGNQWIVIESIFCVTGLVLGWMNRRIMR
jgi:hypothetical protein